MTKETRGRKSLDKKQVIQKLKDYMIRGASLNEACIRARIPNSTIYLWIKYDQKFADEIQYLKDLYRSLLEDVVANEIITKKNARLALEVLERINKNKYSTKIESDINANITAQVVVRQIGMAQVEEKQDEEEKEINPEDIPETIDDYEYQDEK